MGDREKIKKTLSHYTQRHAGKTDNWNATERRNNIAIDDSRDDMPRPRVKNWQQPTSAVLYTIIVLLLNRTKMLRTLSLTPNYRLFYMFFWGKYPPSPWIFGVLRENFSALGLAVTILPNFFNNLSWIFGHYNNVYLKHICAIRRRFSHRAK